MVSQGLDPSLSKEAKEIIELAQKQQNFLLSGGAGSGKTHTLVEVIRSLINLYPTKKIACITYTNAATDEIKRRVDNSNLVVSTIHEFLWANIKQFQLELKKAIIELLLNDEISVFPKPEGVTVDEHFFDGLENGIQYKEYLKISDGIISHDQVLVLAEKMYLTYPKLSSLLKDCYPFIFVDEYQDTNPAVIKTLLDHTKFSPKSNCIGFFGDAMQSIYDDSIGNLDAYVNQSTPSVIEVKKEENRRNPKLVIELANKLRFDGLQQKPSTDKSAPNMMPNGEVKVGNICFIHSNNYDLVKVRENLGWNFGDSTKTKELNLTYNLIANAAGFPDLMRIYNGDHILGFAKRLKKQNKKNTILIDTANKTFAEVISELQEGKTGRELSNVSPSPTMQTYINDHPEEYKLALTLDFDSLSSIYIDKDQLTDGVKGNQDEEPKSNTVENELTKHLCKIQRNIWLYKHGQFNEFLRVTDYKVKSINDKAKLKLNIEQLSDTDGKKIGDLIELAHNYEIVKIDDRLISFKQKNKYIYDLVSKLPYEQFYNFYKLREGYTTFSTQHKTKGTEFDNVLVILDNGNWNNYNFEGLFTNEGTQSVIDRTKKIFYVCCTRAKENLAIFYHSPSAAVLTKAKELFGHENIIDLDV
ncbi:MAG: AAA family ATPase [Methylophilus sp.]|nr:AAA family ATPase [Methylophilus sp.]